MGGYMGRREVVRIRVIVSVIRRAGLEREREREVGDEI